jgi:hypothetical protein
MTMIQLPDEQAAALTAKAAAQGLTLADWLGKLTYHGSAIRPCPPTQRTRQPCPTDGGMRPERRANR